MKDLNVLLFFFVWFNVRVRVGVIFRCRIDVVEAHDYSLKCQ